MASYGDFVLKIHCFQTSEMCPVTICGLFVSLLGLRPQIYMELICRFYSIGPSNVLQSPLRYAGKGTDDILLLSPKTCSFSWKRVVDGVGKMIYWKILDSIICPKLRLWKITKSKWTSNWWRIEDTSADHCQHNLVIGCMYGETKCFMVYGDTSIVLLVSILYCSF